MRLTERAITKINNKTTRTKLALALNFSERWILGLIDKNSPNSPLTTITAIRVIKKETGMDDSEILEEITETEAA